MGARLNASYIVVDAIAGQQAVRRQTLAGPGRIQTRQQFITSPTLALLLA